MKDSNYDSLALVLEAAYDQATEGKGAERHGGGLPFTDQPMQTISNLLQTPDGMAYQACKKITEARGLPTHERRVAELLGAINYIAGMVVWYEQNEGGLSATVRDEAAEELGRLTTAVNVAEPLQAGGESCNTAPVTAGVWRQGDEPIPLPPEGHVVEMECNPKNQPPFRVYTPDPETVDYDGCTLVKWRMVKTEFVEPKSGRPEQSWTPWKSGQVLPMVLGGFIVEYQVRSLHDNNDLPEHLYGGSQFTSDATDFNLYHELRWRLHRVANR